MEEGVLSRSHNHHKQIATHRHQISTLHPLGHFPQSSDSRHLHLISTVTIKSHLSCKPLSGRVHTNSTDSLPDTNRCLGTPTCLLSSSNHPLPFICFVFIPLQERHSHYHQLSLHWILISFPTPFRASAQ